MSLPLDQIERKQPVVRVGVEGASSKRRPIRSDHRPTYSLLAPALLVIIAVVVVPAGFGIYISFTDLNQYTIGNWLHAPVVGLANYTSTLNPSGPYGPSFLESIRASVLFPLATTALSTPLGIGAALLMNGRLRARALFRLVLLLPYVIPVFVSGAAARLMFTQHYGLIDRLLSSIFHSGGNTLWLLGPSSFWALVAVDSWVSWPFIYIITLAGLQTIPNDLYDAAKVDGASGVRTTVAVTLPLVGSAIGLGVLFSTINHFNDFTLPYVMFGPNPPSVANVLPVDIYENAFGLFNFGLGSAMAVISLIIMIVPAALYIRSTKLSEGVDSP